MAKKLMVPLLVVFIVSGAFADARVWIDGTFEWDTLRINAAVSLDLASAGIRIPSGRTRGEMILSENYLYLIRPAILGMQADSSSVIADLVSRGEFGLPEIESIALNAQSSPPALSHDMQFMSSSYTMSVTSVSTALMRHSRPTPVMRTLNPVSSARYTGIVIIAAEELPVYSMRGTAMPVPCLFPKIWDSDMNIVYERSMLARQNVPMVRYCAPHTIFQNNPSGLSPELRETVGDRPLRIFARGVFGITPTDLIIDRRDALLIISSDENRRLLSEGRVAIILNESVLRYNFPGE